MVMVMNKSCLRRASLLADVVVVLAAVLTGCDPPLPPPEPTWAHVEPLLRAHCNHCHGATAEKTGSASGVVYRFDFYDLDAGKCGEAARGCRSPSGPGQSPGPR